MTVEEIRVSRGWLALREPADAAARARDLVEQLARRLPAGGCRVIHDLGCGTGAMGRWLAPLLPGPQHWVLHDRDADLLEVAAADLPAAAADGAAVTVEARQSDITRLHPGDLAGATLITASALLDLLTGDELAGLVTVCAGAGCPVLLTLSVVGRVELTPADPLDARVAAAFDAHQRRTTRAGPPARPGRRRGRRRGVRPAGGGGHRPAQPLAPRRPQADLAAEWFTGWVGAACEQEAELAAETGAYARRRLAEAAAGQLAVTVDHADLLVLPRSRAGARMSRTAWTWTRFAGAAVTLAVLVWRLGTGPFLDGIRTVDGRALAAAAVLARADHRVLCLAVEDRGSWSRHRPAAARCGGGVLPVAVPQRRRFPAGSWATSTAASATVATSATSAAGCGPSHGNAPPGRSCRPS